MAKMTFAGTLSTPMATIGMTFCTCKLTTWHPLTATILNKTRRHGGMTQSLLSTTTLHQTKALVSADCCTLGMLEHHMSSRHELTTGPVLQVQVDLHLPRHRLLSSKAACLPCRLLQHCSAHLHAATPDESCCQALTAAAAAVAATALPLCLKSWPAPDCCACFAQEQVERL